MEEFLDGYAAILSCKDPGLVKHIRIGGYELKDVLKRIPAFKNLEVFECRWGGVFEEIPKAIRQLPKLKELYFFKNYIKHWPADLACAEQLEILDLSGNQLREIPIWMADFKQLKVLNLGANPIDELDDSILKLKHLKKLELTQAKFKKIPELLLKLIPQLTHLYLPTKLRKLLEKEHPKLASEIPYLYQGTALERKQLKKMHTALKTQECSEALEILLLNLLAKRAVPGPKTHQLELLIQATNFKKVEALRLRALEQLEQLSPPEALQSLSDQATVLVLGKFGINKNELRQKLKDHQIKYSAKLSSTCTHLLIGQSPGPMALQALELNLPILTEKNIIDYWESVEQPYLLETAKVAPEQIDLLRSMLSSGQEDSITVAMEMFRQGGFPKGLVTDLFVAYKMLEEGTAAKREAMRLLRQYASAELIAKMKMEQGLFNYKLGESTVSAYLNVYQKQTELDSVYMARLLYQKFQCGYVFLLRQLKEVEARPFVEEELMKDGCLDLSRSSLQAIPPILYKVGEQIKVLNLRSNSIKKILPKIAAFKALQELDLRNNYSLRPQAEEIKARVKSYLPDCKVLL